MAKLQKKDDKVWSADTWTTNADLIYDAWRLGLVKGDVYDATPGLDSLWTSKLRHSDGFYGDSPLICIHSIYINWQKHDFTNFPLKDNIFDTVLFDPPYVSMGGRSTSGRKTFMDRYGLENAPQTPELLHDQLVKPGMIECLRITKPGGHLLMKVKPYISSGKYKPAHHWVYNSLMQHTDSEVVGEFVYIGTPGPQPHRYQKTARNNYSVLFAIQKRVSR